MSDREIMNAKWGLPMWWKPGIAFLREDWINHRDLKHFSNKKCTDTKCTCDNPKLVNLWEHDSCVRGRIDTDVCVQCDEVNSFSIIR
jgi:hypothetical protein